MLALACVFAGGVVGAVRKPPAEDNASVFVYPIKPAQLKKAGIPDFGPPPIEGAKFHANTTSGLGSGSIKTSRDNEAAALSAVRAGTSVYVSSLMTRQNRWLENALGGGGDPKLRGVRRAALTAQVRYAYKFVSPSTGAGSLSAPLRGALLGLLVAGLAGALIGVRRREPAVAGEGELPGAALPRPPSPIQIALAALAAAGLVALSPGLSAGAYTFLFIALLFTLTFIYALGGGTRAIRLVLIAVIVIAPIRGGVLALADAIDLPNTYLIFNAIQPALIAACAAAVLLVHRSLLRDEPYLLLVGWAAIGVACVLDFGTQTVGLKLYGIGIAQYLVYPTFALLVWPLLEARDRERLVWLLAGLGVVVAVSIFLEVAGVYFTEAVQDPHRFGGVTGSYLHSAIFLGTTMVLALGLLFADWSHRNAAIAVGAIGLMVGGVGLTYSRGGFGIAIVGALVMFVALRGRDRTRLAAVVIVATALGLGLSSAAGPNAGQLASRTTSGASVQGDPGNAKRIAAMKKALNEYKALPAKEKAFGKGVASTGNAGKLTSAEPDPTESYPLKLLVETGAFGLLVIGGVLIWALIRFGRTAWQDADPMLKGVGAAGIGLSAESLIYPTLEVQLLSLTFWLLLVICLEAPEKPLWDRLVAARAGRAEAKRGVTSRD
jgi:O-antigen ligase/polysaccharide polymerase Wzy-like membrane protein